MPNIVLKVYLCYTNLVFDSKNNGFMYKVSRKVFSPHPVATLYSVVNDTNAYRYFVPFCTESRVLEDRGSDKDCLLVFSKGPVSSRLITRNGLVENQTISVALVEGDFESLKGLWRFEEVDGGTWVSLDFEYQFSHRIVQYTFGQIFRPLSYELVQTFCQRADEISVR